jgi:hypothetical protein
MTVESLILLAALVAFIVAGEAFIVWLLLFRLPKGGKDE